MDAHDFQIELIEDIKTEAAVEGEGSSAAFVELVTNHLQGADVLCDFIPAFYLGVGKNNRKIRVDGYALDELDYTLNLIIADYTGNIEREVLTKTMVSSLFDRLVHFIEETYENRLAYQIEESTPVSDLIELMRSNQARIRKYRLMLLTDGFMSGRINTLPARELIGIPIELQIWDIERIFQVCASDESVKSEIDFTKFTSQGIPCIEASSTNSEEYKSYLCIMPGKTLADIYDLYGSQLLEGNVRSFLTTKVSVNKKIRETILKMPDNFFAYNNGVSATAIDLQIEMRPEGRFITYAKDFQIINGGQTTASLSTARHKDKADLDKIYVQMKLTEIDSDMDKASDLVRNISRSSNSQNKVSDADFFSTHPFHIRMEQISRRLFAPPVDGAQYGTKWFYERSRGQYFQAEMKMTKSEKAKYETQNPKKQVITKTDFAKVRNTWRGFPQIVSKGAQTNFIHYADFTDANWDLSDSGFNEKYFKDTVALIILFRHTEALVTHQPWYEQGYRANIVTYSLALLRKLVKDQFSGQKIDLQLIWIKQKVPDMLSTELIKITKAVYEEITSPTRETVNVTQWCKRDACWKKIQMLHIPLDKQITKLLADIEVEKADEKEARSDQHLISDVEAQTKILDYSSEFWTKVYAFVLKKKLGTPDSREALKIAMHIPNKLPTASQSVKILELLETAESEGFKK